MDIEGVEGHVLKVVRQEFGGQVSTHVRCDISSGAVINIRPGAFKPHGRRCRPAGTVVDKSAEVGALDGRPPLSGDRRRRSRRCGYHQGAGAGFDRPRHPGAGERRDRRGTGRGHGRGGELLASGGGCQVDGEVAAGRLVRPDGEAEGLPGVRHQRIVPASGRHQGQSVHRRHQQEPEGADLPGGGRRNRRRHPGVPAGVDQQSS